MTEHADDEQLALRYLSKALQALDRTNHTQVAAMVSHALEMLRDSQNAAIPAREATVVYQ